MSDPSLPFDFDQAQGGTVRGQMLRRRRSPLENLFRSFIGMLAGFGFGGALVYGVVWDAWQGFATLRWSQTQGVIKSINVEHFYRTNGGTDFQLNLLYTYAVDGKQYENTRRRFPESLEGGDKGYEKILVERYRTGSKHPVYYDPDNPARSCLEKGPRYFYAYVLGGLAALFLLIGTVCLLSIPSALKRAAAG